MKIKIIFAVVIVVLVAGNVYFFIKLRQTESKNLLLKSQLEQANADSAKQLTADKAELGDLKAKNDALVAEASLGAHFPASIVSSNKQDFKTVKLANKEFYYGIISGYTGGVITLNNIFYTQGFVDFSSPTQAPSQISLIKKGKETDGGEDTMFIKDSSIVSIETLSPDSKVWQAIGEYTKSLTN